MGLMPPSATYSLRFSLPPGADAPNALRDTVAAWAAALHPFLGHIKGSAQGPGLFVYASSTGSGVTTRDLTPGNDDDALVVQVTAIVLQVTEERLEETARAVAAALAGRYPVTDLETYGTEETEPHHHEHDRDHEHHHDHHHKT